MSTKRRTVEPPDWLQILLEDIKNGIPPDIESYRYLYKRVEHEIPYASLDDVTKAFHRRVEEHLKGTTLRTLVGREAARAYSDLFYLNSFLSSIAVVTYHGIEHLLRRKEQITPEALSKFWELSPLAELVRSEIDEFASPRTFKVPLGGIGSALNYLLRLRLLLRYISTGDYSEGLSKDHAIWRIRKCWNCGNLFWAGRVDKLTCSTKCADARRQALVRMRKRDKGQQYREQYRKNQQAYRDRKKANDKTVAMYEEPE
jgi:hypothetical protein